MYNFKKIYRQKSNFLLIIIFSFLFLCLVFLFKYMLIVKTDIESKIYDKHKNKEIIVYENKEQVIKDLMSINEVSYIYPDYQTLEIENEKFGIFSISPYLIKEMPTLLKGKYPKTSNEILLPNYTFVNNKKIFLAEYINKDISFTLNNFNEIEFKVSGVFDADSEIFSAYYNLENIDDILKQTPSYNYTGNTRVLVDHYKNVNKVLNFIASDASLYDISGLEEINVYESLFDLILMLIYIIVLFIAIIIIVVSSILYHNTKERRFIQFALGYCDNKIARDYVNYYLKLLIISFILCLIYYFLGIFLYSNFIRTNNLLLNSIFAFNLNFIYLIPIVSIILLITLLLYLIIYFRMSKSKLY